MLFKLQPLEYSDESLYIESRFQAGPRAPKYFPSEDIIFESSNLPHSQERISAELIVTDIHIIATNSKGV